MKNYAFIRAGVVVSMALMEDDEAQRLAPDWAHVCAPPAEAVQVGWQYDAATGAFSPPLPAPAVLAYQLVVLEASVPSKPEAAVTAQCAALDEGDTLRLRIQVRAPGKNGALKSFSAPDLDFTWATPKGRERMVAVNFEAGVGVLKICFKDNGRWQLTAAAVREALSEVLNDAPIEFDGYAARVRARD